MKGHSTRTDALSGATHTHTLGSRTNALAGEQICRANGYDLTDGVLIYQYLSSYFFSYDILFLLDEWVFMWYNIRYRIGEGKYIHIHTYYSASISYYI